ncbi:hypothetical protein GE09DRAFT_1246046 [Coniochaeta sp. 2T2.1]|nr:hypothetical protein GE09DRAFT_1246046 [Coniochaeta sp. 2T2.1]
MARKQSLIPRLILFSLLYPSCAWAKGGHDEADSDLLQLQRNGLVRRGEELVQLQRHGLAGRDEPSARETLWSRVEAEVVQIVEEQVQIIILDSQPPNHRRDTPSPAAVAPRIPQVTPPPSLTLYKRQNDDQIQQLSGQIQSISQSFRSVSQASQQVSQSSQQLSNSLQQAQQQLSQTQQSLASARASADAARQSAEQANQAAQQASRDADQARQSADRAVSSAQSSASAAAEAAGRSAASSAASSVASVIAAMSTSAQLVMSSAASLVQAAKADATAVRSEADTRVLEAQGAAVSVTQAALAIVGAIIGSSLITIFAFVMVLRYKRRRRYRRSLAAAARREGGGSIGYPGPQGSSNDMAGSYEKSSSYPVDIKPPEPTIQPQRVGFAKAIGANRASFRLAEPPKRNLKYSVFPRSNQQPKDVEAAGVSPTSEYSVDNEKKEAQRQSKVDSPPSLEKWLRVGTNVSPFGTLNVISTTGGGGGGQARKNANWPLGRKGSS